jgi:hypothetical protein
LATTSKSNAERRAKLVEKIASAVLARARVVVAVEERALLANLELRAARARRAGF